MPKIAGWSRADKAAVSLNSFKNIHAVWTHDELDTKVFVNRDSELEIYEAIAFRAGRPKIIGTKRTQKSALEEARKWMKEHPRGY
jgi:hypothetical protein